MSEPMCPTCGIRPPRRKPFRASRPARCLECHTRVQKEHDKRHYAERRSVHGIENSWRRELVRDIAPEEIERRYAAALAHIRKYGLP